jgi:hypothetical protein
MITPPPGTRVWLAGGFTDMRKGFDGLAKLVQEKLRRDPYRFICQAACMLYEPELRVSELGRFHPGSTDE